jgi:hypothetical protein
MQKIPENASLETVRTGVTTELADVEADEAVASLATPYRTVIDQFLELYLQVWPLEREWILADARLKVLDRYLDQEVKAFRLELVQRSGNKQSGPLFDLYLPEGLRAVTEAEPAVAEPAQVERINRKLETNGGDLDTTWRPRLTSAREAVLTGAGVRHGVELRQQSLELRLDAMLGTLQHARVELHAALRTHFKTDPSQAEHYFYAWRRRPARKRPAEDAPTS